MVLSTTTAPNSAMMATCRTTMAAIQIAVLRLVDLYVLSIFFNTEIFSFLQFCGDGVKNGVEVSFFKSCRVVLLCVFTSILLLKQCDDGNIISKDGCSNCTIDVWKISRTETSIHINLFLSFFIFLFNNRTVATASSTATAQRSKNLESIERLLSASRNLFSFFSYSNATTATPFNSMAAPTARSM